MLYSVNNARVKFDSFIRVLGFGVLLSLEIYKEMITVL